MKALQTNTLRGFLFFWVIGCIKKWHGDKDTPRAQHILKLWVFPFFLIVLAIRLDSSTKNQKNAWIQFVFCLITIISLIVIRFRMQKGQTHIQLGCSIPTRNVETRNCSHAAIASVSLEFQGRILATTGKQEKGINHWHCWQCIIKALTCVRTISEAGILDFSFYVSKIPAAYQHSYSCAWR